MAAESLAGPIAGDFPILPLAGALPADPGSASEPFGVAATPDSGQVYITTGRRPTWQTSGAAA